MHSELRAQLAFRLAGLRLQPSAFPARGVRPALAARHRPLEALRYDFPVVLLANPANDELALPLTQLTDRLAAKIDPAAADAAEKRLALLRAERDVRHAVASGKPGTLRKLWPAAADALGVDGEIVDCDGTFPAKAVLHAWNVVEKGKAARFHAEADRLAARLREIMKADEARSPEARTAEALCESVGAMHRDAFDFESMAQILERAFEGRPLPEARRRRIHAQLAALTAQRFFTDPPAHGMVFDGCGEALQAFRARYPEMRSFARTLAAAGLECEGRYDGVRHDALFHHLAETPLTRDELAPFPSLLVCVREGDMDATARAELIDLLACGAPVKVLLQFDDLLPPTGLSDVLGDVAARADAFTGLAMGLGHVFVLQAPSSSMPQMHRGLVRALAYPGPALISVFSGASESASLPPYLNAAAALESRAFPAFTWDPSKALDSGERFSIAGNPQPDRDWPRHALEFEDREHQAVREDYAFTAADFLAAHERFARHFMPLPPEDGGSCIAVDECLDRADVEGAGAALAVVDDKDKLYRMAVDDTMLELARGCRERWRRLQQMAKLGLPLAAPAPAVSAPPEAAPAPEAQAAPAPAVEAPKAAASDEAYIETPRCTTCEECMAINKQMFKYDGNKQAYIASLDAGTYRQLVEAAEACQVSIIHPGKPRNANEPGLEELVERARPFL
ncbi:MAG TPA: hypothetical protein VFP44_22915 [Usitatibacter sp.]|nr:hypothetical protein [Usitatibacter sp.]